MSVAFIRIIKPHSSTATRSLQSGLQQSRSSTQASQYRHHITVISVLQFTSILFITGKNTSYIRLDWTSKSTQDTLNRRLIPTACFEDPDLLLQMPYEDDCQGYHCMGSDRMWALDNLSRPQTSWYLHQGRQWKRTNAFPAWRTFISWVRKSSSTSSFFSSSSLSFSSSVSPSSEESSLPSSSWERKVHLLTPPFFKPCSILRCITVQK